MALAQSGVPKKKTKKKIAEEKRMARKVLEARNRRLCLKPIKLRILAIDPATKCGWAISIKDYGMWNLTNKRNKTIWETNGDKWLKFEAHLKRMIKIYKINVLAWEMPVWNRMANAFMHHSKMVGILERVASELCLPFIEVDPVSIKMIATGNGAAKKPDMIRMANKTFKLKLTEKQDNEADALWILHLAKVKIIRNEANF